MVFLRRTHNRYSKLGKRRKKKQTWRKPTGRDNKMREKRRGYPVKVSIGYKKCKENKSIIILTPKELEKIDKKTIIIIGKVGKKKKIEIAKKAKEMKVNLSNLNVNSFLKKNKLKKKEAKDKKSKESEK